MDGWDEFLKARMRVICDALRQGKNVIEINHLVGVDPMQLSGLIHYATKLNLEKENFHVSGEN